SSRSASCPFAASTTRYPSASRNAAIAPRMSSSSSTTRIACFVSTAGSLTASPTLVRRTGRSRQQAGLDTVRPCSRGARVVIGFRRGRERQGGDELRTATEPFARHAHHATVALDQVLDDRQAEAETTALALADVVGLTERLEDLWQEARRDALALVAHRD